MHGRLEALLLFFIDGANFIDADDPQWELLLVVPSPPLAEETALTSGHNCVVRLRPRHTLG